MPIHPAVQEAIDRGEHDIRLASPKSLDELCPYIPTSDTHDAYYITAWAIYHTGKRPIDLRKTRGHAWKAEIHGRGECILTVKRADHRNGIECTEI